MKKGFTLIELLAVIVILAIIALIATPIIINIINDARESANKRSIELYGKSVENSIAKAQLNGDEVTSIDGLTIDYTGNEVICETKKFYSDGTIYLAGCTVGGVAVDYTYGAYQQKPCTWTDSDSDGVYDVGEIVSCGSNDNFYIMSSTSNTITMLTEYNIDTVDARQSLSADTISFSAYPYWLEDENGDECYVYNYCTMKQEYGSSNTGQFVYDENSDLYSIVEEYETYLKNTLNVNSASATLMSEDQAYSYCDNYDCSSAPSWLYDSYYWLGSNYDDSMWESNIFRYNWDYTLIDGDYTLYSSYYGVRPVITISTSDID